MNRLLEKYRRRWLNLHNMSAAANREAADEGVALAYRAAGLPPPRKIIWCGSPVGIERSRKENWFAANPGISVKSSLVDGLLGKAHEAVRQRLPYHIFTLIAGKMASPNQLLATARTVNRAVLDAAIEPAWGWSDLGKAVRLRLSGKGPVIYTPLEYAGWAQHDSRDLLATHQFLHDVYELKTETGCLAGLWQIALNAGWLVPHERVCWLSDRPSLLQTDAQGRLHSAKGPALMYPDGWSHYAWKGISVPRWIIEQPEEITARMVERQNNILIRRCMIDIMTPERYVASGYPRRVATDAAGTLWRREWNSMQMWAAVEVVNGTPGPDGAHKHYFLQVPPDITTPTRAVAWTYGISAESYAALMLRT